MTVKHVSLQLSVRGRTCSACAKVTFATYAWCTQTPYHEGSATGNDLIKGSWTQAGHSTTNWLWLANSWWHWPVETSTSHSVTCSWVMYQSGKLQLYNTMCQSVANVGAKKWTCLVLAVVNVWDSASILAEITDLSDFKSVIGVLHRTWLWCCCCFVTDMTGKCLQH